MPALFSICCTGTSIPSRFYKTLNFKEGNENVRLIQCQCYGYSLSVLYPNKVHLSILNDRQITKSQCSWFFSKFITLAFQTGSQIYIPALACATKTVKFRPTQTQFNTHSIAFNDGILLSPNLPARYLPRHNWYIQSGNYYLEITLGILSRLKSKLQGFPIVPRIIPHPRSSS